MSSTPSLDQLTRFAQTADIGSLDYSHLTPGKIAITIHSDGHWSYQGTPFDRLEMVKLLSQSLVIVDGEYCLIAPEQLLKITVEDTPFYITKVNKSGEQASQTVVVTSNLGQSVTLDDLHQLELAALPDNTVEIPCVHIVRGLYARLSRASFYQLVEWGERANIDGREVLRIFSGGESHILGYLD